MRRELRPVGSRRSVARRKLDTCRLRAYRDVRRIRQDAIESPLRGLFQREPGMSARCSCNSKVSFTRHAAGRRPFILFLAAIMALGSSGWPSITLIPKVETTSGLAAAEGSISQPDDDGTLKPMLSKPVFRCCCAVNGHFRNCCCTAGAKPGKSCCSARKDVAQRAPMRKPQPIERDLIPLFAACHCGDGPNSASISVDQPRLHSIREQRVALLPTAEAPLMIADQFQSVLQAPETPPPRPAA